jgi:preprotein translocase subunit SecG
VRSAPGWRPDRLRWFRDRNQPRASGGWTTDEKTEAMTVVRITLQVLLVLTSLFLTLLILLHKGRGGGLSDMFGGGASSSLGSSGVAERNLNRFTILVALVWIAVVVMLGVLQRFES